MCGRFAVTSLDPDLMREYGIEDIPVNFQARYNLAPSQLAPVIPNYPERKLEMFRWGLIPGWAKDEKIGYKMINARAETAAEKPSFRAAFKRRRCLVVASGFYEWKKQKSGKVPHFIRLKSKMPFGFAGLWESWEPEGKDELRTFTIITTEPNQLLSGIHNRMPVILPPNGIDTWLSPDPVDRTDLQKLLGPYPAQEMEAYPVSTLVNSPKNDVPDCIQPA